MVSSQLTVLCRTSQLPALRPPAAAGDRCEETVVYVPLKLGELGGGRLSRRPKSSAPTPSPVTQAPFLLLAQPEEEGWGGPFVVLPWSSCTHGERARVRSASRSISELVWRHQGPSWSQAVASAATGSPHPDILQGDSSDLGSEKLILKPCA